MNPFLEIPAVERIAVKGLFGKKIAVKHFTARILPGEIVGHKPNGGGSILFLRSGHIIETTLSQDTVDDARQTYDVIMKKNPGRTENLCIVLNENKQNGTDNAKPAMKAVSN